MYQCPYFAKFLVFALPLLIAALCCVTFKNIKIFYGYELCDSIELLFYAIENKAFVCEKEWT